MNKRSVNTVVRMLLLFGVAVLLAACGGSRSAAGFNGIWGGVLTANSGNDFAVFAMDVRTGSNGAVSGRAILRGSGGDVNLNVTGQAQATTVALRLVDGRGGFLQLTGTVQSQVVRGLWTFPAEGFSGNFRMAREENINLLSLNAAGELVDSLSDAIAW